MHPNAPNAPNAMGVLRCDAAVRILAVQGEAAAVRGVLKAGGLGLGLGHPPPLNMRALPFYLCKGHGTLTCKVHFSRLVIVLSCTPAVLFRLCQLVNFPPCLAR